MKWKVMMVTYHKIKEKTLLSHFFFSFFRHLWTNRFFYFFFQIFVSNCYLIVTQWFHNRIKCCCKNDLNTHQFQVFYCYNCTHLNEKFQILQYKNPMCILKIQNRKTIACKTACSQLNTLFFRMISRQKKIKQFKNKREKKKL